MAYATAALLFICAALILVLCIGWCLIIRFFLSFRRMGRVTRSAEAEFVRCSAKRRRLVRDVDALKAKVAKLAPDESRQDRSSVSPRRVQSALLCNEQLVRLAVQNRIYVNLKGASSQPVPHRSIAVGPSAEPLRRASFATHTRHSAWSDSDGDDLAPVFFSGPFGVDAITLRNSSKAVAAVASALDPSSPPSAHPLPHLWTKIRDSEGSIISVARKLLTVLGSARPDAATSRTAVRDTSQPPSTRLPRYSTEGVVGAPPPVDGVGRLSTSVGCTCGQVGTCAACSALPRLPQATAGVAASSSFAAPIPRTSRMSFYKGLAPEVSGSEAKVVNSGRLDALFTALGAATVVEGGGAAKGLGYETPLAAPLKLRGGDSKPGSFRSGGSFVVSGGGPGGAHSKANSFRGMHQTSAVQQHPLGASADGVGGSAAVHSSPPRGGEATPSATSPAHYRHLTRGTRTLALYPTAPPPRPSYLEMMAMRVMLVEREAFTAREGLEQREAESWSALLAAAGAHARCARAAVAAREAEVARRAQQRADAEEREGEARVVIVQSEVTGRGRIQAAAAADWKRMQEKAAERAAAAAAAKAFLVRRETRAREGVVEEEVDMRERLRTNMAFSLARVKRMIRQREEEAEQQRQREAEAAMVRAAIQAALVKLEEESSEKVRKIQKKENSSWNKLLTWHTQELAAERMRQEALLARQRQMEADEAARRRAGEEAERARQAAAEAARKAAEEEAARQAALPKSLTQAGELNAKVRSISELQYLGLLTDYARAGGTLLGKPLNKAKCKALSGRLGGFYLTDDEYSAIASEGAQVGGLLPIVRRLYPSVDPSALSAFNDKMRSCAQVRPQPPEPDDFKDDDLRHKINYLPNEYFFLLEHDFRECDADGNGTLDFEELGGGTGELAGITITREVFDMMDVDGGGSIDVHEFVSGLLPALPEADALRFTTHWVDRDRFDLVQRTFLDLHGTLEDGLPVQVLIAQSFKFGPWTVDPDALGTQLNPDDPDSAVHPKATGSASLTNILVALFPSCPTAALQRMAATSVDPAEAEEFAKCFASIADKGRGVGGPAVSAEGWTKAGVVPVKFRVQHSSAGHGEHSDHKHIKSAKEVYLGTNDHIFEEIAPNGVMSYLDYLRANYYLVDDATLQKLAKAA